MTTGERRVLVALYKLVKKMAWFQAQMLLDINVAKATEVQLLAEELDRQVEQIGDGDF